MYVDCSATHLRRLDPKTVFADDQVGGLIWTVAEPATGIICSCLPVMRPVIVVARDTYRSLRSRGSRSRLNDSDDTEAINGTRPSQRSDDTWNQANGRANYSLSNLERDGEARRALFH